GGGRLEEQLHRGARLVALAGAEVVVLVAGRVPAQGAVAGDGAGDEGDLGGEQEGAEEAETELADEGGRLLGGVEGEALAQLAGVTPADGGEVGADLLLGEPVAVVADGEGPALGVAGDVDAGG